MKKKLISRASKSTSKETQPYLDNVLALAIVANRAPPRYLQNIYYLKQAWQFLVDTKLAFELGDAFEENAMRAIKRGHAIYNPDAPKQYLLSRPWAEQQEV